MIEELKCPACGSNMDISYWEINHECQNGKTHYQLKNYPVIRWCAKEIERKDAEIARLREALEKVGHRSQHGIDCKWHTRSMFGKADCDCGMWDAEEIIDKALTGGAE